MEYIKTRTIMTKSDKKDRFFGIDYHMNLYKGCTYGCIYCEARSEIFHINNFEKIKAKDNALEILEKELASKNYKGVVSFGTLSDPYNEEEKHLKLTRGALELIKKYSFGVSIDTKSDLILRDLDLLKEINKHNNVIIKISICTTDEELSKKLEPNVISPQKRLNILKTLNENGIFSGVLLMPVLPFITDNEENIKSCVYKAHKNKAKFIFTRMNLNLRNKSKEYYYEKIDKIYPKLSNDYKAVYDKKIFCAPLKYKKLLETFVDECNKYHLLCDMTEIINAYKKEVPSTKQISLF